MIVLGAKYAKMTGEIWTGIILKIQHVLYTIGVYNEIIKIKKRDYN